MSSSPGTTYHSPLQWFSSEGIQEKACLVILNSKLYGLDHVLRSYWHKFAVCVCADGGSNSLYKSFPGERECYIPQYICGDLDSATEEVCQYYKDRGAEIVRMTDQDNTDFTKTLQYLITLLEAKELEFSRIYALNAQWGRLDQTLANINTLYSFHEQLHSAGVELFLVSDDSILLHLAPGCHAIDVTSGLEEGHCGLIPLGEPCASCTTTGLRWNLAGQSMKMGGLISTSNLLEAGAQQVTVKTSHPLVWTMSHKLLSATQ